jgi:hypothetical protein
MAAGATLAFMSTRLSDLSVDTLRRMLRSTLRAVGEDFASVRALRRAIKAKQGKNRKEAAR